MRISKRTREQAALLCQMAASTNRGHGVIDGMRWMRDRYFKINSRVIDRDPAYVLAGKAFNRAYASEWTRTPLGFQDWVSQLAEAESLLRTGWCPDE